MTPLIDIVRTTPSDGEALALFLAQTAEYRAVPIAIVNAYLIDHFIIGNLRLARDDAAMPLPVRSYLGTLLTGIQVAEAFHGESPVIRAATEQVLEVLVQAQVMSQADADGFRALYTVTASATLADVAAARLSLAKSATLAAAEAWISSVRAVVLFAVDVAALPPVPAPLAVEVVLP